MKKGAAFLLVSALNLALHFPAAGQFYPLPAWYFYGGGTAANGTWSGTSTAPDNALLSVTISPPPQPPGTYESAVATSASSVLVIAPHSTYTLTFSANVNGTAHANSFFAGDTATITGISLSGSGWKNYTNAFTSGGNTDPFVGQNLYAQLVLTGQGSAPGSTTASFTNIQLTVATPRPSLTISRVGTAQVVLRWPTNFDWCIPEAAAELPSTNWDGVTNARSVQSNQFVIPLNVEPGQRVFRLRGE